MDNKNDSNLNRIYYAIIGRENIRLAFFPTKRGIKGEKGKRKRSRDRKRNKRKVKRK